MIDPEPVPPVAPSWRFIVTTDGKSSLATLGTEHDAEFAAALVAARCRARRAVEEIADEAAHDPADQCRNCEGADRAPAGLVCGSRSPDWPVRRESTLAV